MLGTAGRRAGPRFRLARDAATRPLPYELVISLGHSSWSAGGESRPFPAASGEGVFTYKHEGDDLRARTLMPCS